MTSSTTVDLIDRSSAIARLPRRTAYAHKWGVGGLVVIGGAPGYIGAPALAAISASRSGAGIVSLAVPRSSVGPTATLVPEAVFIPLPETDSTHGVQRALELMTPIVEKSNALLVGPGLSRDEAASSLLAALFGRMPRTPTRSVGFGSAQRTAEVQSEVALIGGATPTVVDADALHWLSKQDAWWENVAPNSLVLTPHVGELAALRGEEPAEILADPAEAARRAAEAWRQIVVVKAGRAYISDGHTVLSLRNAAPALATAGSGDVLAGSIGAFLAQGLAPVDAAALAIYAGTEAAIRLTVQLSTLGVIASDLPVAIAQVLSELEQERGEES